MIEVTDLTRRYGSFTAVDGLSFTVEPGTVLGLVGPNGAGKTSTLRVLAGILHPHGGSVRIAGHDLEREPLEAKRALAYMPDEPRLFEYLTVREHLEFISRVYRVEDASAKSDALLEELELADRARSLPAELSRGMKQKLVIACGLLHSPRALIFDEPLTGLDPIAIRKVKATILKRAREGACVLLSSHLLHLVEEVADKILILVGGKRMAYGTEAEIRRQLPELSAAANLEEIFMQVAGHPGEARPDGA